MLAIWKIIIRGLAPSNGRSPTANEVINSPHMIPLERRTNEDLRTGINITIKGSATINNLLVLTPCPLLVLTPNLSVLEL